MHVILFFSAIKFWGCKQPYITRLQFRPLQAPLHSGPCYATGCPLRGHLSGTAAIRQSCNWQQWRWHSTNNSKSITFTNGCSKVLFLKEQR